MNSIPKHWPKECPYCKSKMIRYSYQGPEMLYLMDCKGKMIRHSYQGPEMLYLMGCKCLDCGKHIEVNNAN